MSDVYNNPPMHQATTRLLAGFWIETMSSTEPNCIFPILEVGAGIGRTARYLVNYLIEYGTSFEHIFTDIPSALVGAVTKRFARKDSMRFTSLDCNKSATPRLGGIDFEYGAGSGCCGRVGEWIGSAKEVVCFGL